MKGWLDSGCGLGCRRLASLQSSIIDRIDRIEHIEKQLSLPTSTCNHSLISVRYRPLTERNAIGMVVFLQGLI